MSSTPEEQASSSSAESPAGSGTPDAAAGSSTQDTTVGPDPGAGSPPDPPPETVGHATSEPAVDAEGGRPNSLRSLLFGRPSRVQLVVAVLLAALGFAAVVQVRLTHTSDDFAGARRDDLVELLDSLSGAADRAQQQIDDLQKTRTALLSTSLRRKAALREIRGRIHVLQVLTGSVAVTGPGVVVTIDDPRDALTAPDLLDAVNELRDAGAEAIEINDKVRVVASTSFTSATGAITAGGVALRPPYVLDVVGASHTLSEAVDFPGGIGDEAAAVGGSVTTDQSSDVRISSLHTMTQSQYARPTP